MTHQNRETFYYEGEKLESYHKPLRAPPKLPDFFPISSLCWLGYNGTWNIKNKKLYLVNIHTDVNHAIELHIKQRPCFDFENDDFFYETVQEPIPAKAILKNLYCEAGEDGLLASWFTGNVNLGLNEIAFKGMHNKNKKYLLLRFENGVFTEEQVITFKEAYPPEPEKAI